MENNLKYVSRGGGKLHGALQHFHLSVQDRICLDIGSSHGGFTDCLLQHGAKSVWCVDVGKGLMEYKFRSDPRVHLLEEQNIRWLDNSLITEKIALITVDVSFIALDKVFAKISELISAGGDVLTLVKPQFEGTPKEAPGGFVKDEPTRQLILSRVREKAEQAGFTVKGIVDSEVKGRKGNQETFFYLTYNKAL